MWFRNLQLFRLNGDFDIDGDELGTRLQEYRFRACGPLEQATVGWTEPAGRHPGELVRSVNGCFMIAARREEKLLPASVVTELLNERCVEVEDREGRALGRKERQQLREELVFELLPRALCRTQRTYAYLAPRDGWLIVDASSPRRAEELTVLLRKSLGSLPLGLPNTLQSPVAVMTRWLGGEDLPAELNLEDECELRSADEEGSVVRCRNQDLSAPEVASHLQAGKQVVRLALTWRDRMSLVLDEQLGVRRLRFLDVVQDQAGEIETDDELERFDADFALMTLELSAFLTRLPQWFGGEAPGSSQDAAKAA